jgi:hypothetical protein
MGAVGRGGGVRSTADLSPDARQQLTMAEGLGDVVVGSELEAGDAVVLGRARREHDDGHVPRVGARPQDAADFHAADDRQIQVEDDEVGRFFGDRLQRGVAAADDVRFRVAGALECVLDETRDIVLVLTMRTLRDIRVSQRGMGGRIKR